MGKLFGTNGVRGIVNQDLTTDLALRLGRAIGSWLPPGSLVAVARDARASGPMFEAAAAAGLLAAGARVVRLGICATPAAQYYVKNHDDVKAGLVITASHNPPEYNGLKLVAADGTETSRVEEDAVEGLYFAERFRVAKWDQLHDPASDDSATPAYVEAVLSRVDVDRIRGRRFRVVLDAGGGPGVLATLPILRRLGCEVTTLFEALDGEFRGRKSEPVEDNLGLLRKTVKEKGADLGIAHDGDADRCIFVDEAGTWVSGDASLALLAQAAVERSRGGIVSTPVSTSSVLEEAVKPLGGRVEWTAVGSPIVARAMMRSKAVFGGEENGGVIFPDHQYCRDGAMTAAKLVELLAMKGKPLSALVGDLPRFHQSKKKFPVPVGQREALLERLRAWVAREFPTARVDTTDGLKVYLPNGWVLIRPSGTESIFRVFAESHEREAAEANAGRFVDAGQMLAAAPVTR